MKMEDTRKYVAELVGTAALVFMGCGSAVIAGQRIGYLGISFAFGLTVLAMVYAIGNISGCHINPAITVAMLVTGKIKAKDAAAYIIAQCVGAILGAGILLLIARGLPSYSIAADGLGQNGYELQSPSALLGYPGYSMLASFIAEVVLTALFLFVIFGSTSKNAPQGFAGISIGLTLVLIHIVGIPITGTSVNPARSLGPAVFVQGEALTQLWLFWAAPIIGAVIAALAWKFLFEQKS
jgi:aquaporin Z